VCVLRAIVKRWHVIEARAAGVQEHFAPADGNLLERLETIDRESGTKNGDRSDAARGQLCQRCVGGWLQPALGAEA